MRDGRKMKMTHLDTPGTPGVLTRTGKLVKFSDVSIGQPFWAHGKVWVRTSYEAATTFGSTSQYRYGHMFPASCCNFMIDKIDREVEAMTYGDQDENHKSAWRVKPGDNS